MLAEIWQIESPAPWSRKFQEGTQSSNAPNFDVGPTAVHLWFKRFAQLAPFQYKVLVGSKGEKDNGKIWKESLKQSRKGYA